MLTYRIGGRGTDFTFAGSIAEQNSASATNLVKTGAGVWTLSGTLNTYGATTVEAGTLRLTGTLTNPAANPLEIRDSATLDLAGGTVNVPLHIADGGTLSGHGTLAASLTNDGTLTADGAGTLTITGSVTNNGTAIFTRAAALAVTGTFTNNGLLDLLTGAQTLPANLVNNGVVLDRGLVKVASAVKSGGTFTVKIDSFAAHTYQLQRADSPGGAWSHIGGAQPGAHTVNADGSLTPVQLTFTDTGGATGPQRYYHISVGP